MRREQVCFCVGKFFNEKILFGISLYFLSRVLIFWGEYKNALIVSKDFETSLCFVLLLFGFIMSIWGLLEKDKYSRLQNASKRGTRVA